MSGQLRWVHVDWQGLRGDSERSWSILEDSRMFEEGREGDTESEFVIVSSGEFFVQDDHLCL